MIVKCPACVTGKTSVIDTMDSGDVVTRRERCLCGARWISEQRVKRGSYTGAVATVKPTVTEAPRLSSSSDLRSGSDLISDSDPSQQSGSVRPARARGKAREYTGIFETAWAAYGRKEEKGKAFEAWRVAAASVDGEGPLLALVLGALEWQGPLWAADGWQYAKYFERYLKRRRWEDGRPPVATAPAKPPLRSIEDQVRINRQAEAERLLAQRKRSDAEAQAVVDRVKAQGGAR